ncbi:MAG: pyrroloquinoline quinone-dependent dehydrogenase [Myxococcota bacterium]
MKRAAAARALALATALAAAACGRAPVEIEAGGPVADWPLYAGRGSLHASPLTQITPGNAHALEVAWTHHSGDVYDGSGRSAVTAHQATPLVVDDTLYYCTPFQRVFALDPETGAERWVFDPELRAVKGAGPYPLACRGLSYWRDPQAEEGAACARRLYLGTKDSELIALDARTGAPCEGFGEHGRVALREGIGEAAVWEYYPTSPGYVIGDVIVLGALVADNVRVDAPSGVVRAFDLRTGALRWAWDPVPPGFAKAPDPATGRVYARGTPNVWSIISGDAERGLVFVPTGNPSPDLYGGQRDGIDYYGSSVVALDAATGAVRWHFQVVHHDVWDYDVPSPPALFAHPGVGGGRPALAQSTKMGMVFLLDRETGEPLYPVEERPVSQAAAPGETPAPTQPFPTHPKPLHDYAIGPDDVFGFTPFDRRACRDLVARYRRDGLYTAPSLEGSIVYPHTSGGMNWGGVAIDEAKGLLLVNQLHVAMVAQLVPRAEADAIDKADVTYPEEFYPMTGTPYGVRRFPLFSPFGAPCSPPPWGSLTAVDLASGEVVWKVPLGNTRDLAPFPLEMGVPNFGGGLVTAGGVYFIGATVDRTFRAFDVANGRVVFEARLPADGTAVPMTYRLGPDRRQFVVVAAGGNPLGTMGDALVAFALPQD